jgi:hypothetical protein
VKLMRASHAEANSGPSLAVGWPGNVLPSVPSSCSGVVVRPARRSLPFVAHFFSRREVQRTGEKGWRGGSAACLPCGRPLMTEDAAPRERGCRRSFASAPLQQSFLRQRENLPLRSCFWRDVEACPWERMTCVDERRHFGHEPVRLLHERPSEWLALDRPVQSIVDASVLCDLREGSSKVSKWGRRRSTGSARSTAGAPGRDQIASASLLCRYRGRPVEAC